MTPVSAHEARFGLVSWALAIGLTVLLLTTLGRVAQLQISPSTALAAHIEPRVTTRLEPSLRGDLTDSRGRLLAVTRFGTRAVVDPTLLPDDPSDVIAKLAEVIETPAEALGERVVAALMENERRAIAKAAWVAEAAAPPAPGSGEDGDDEADAAPPRGPIRYLVLSSVLTDEQARAIEDLKLRGVILDKVRVREYTGGAEVASIVGKVGFEHAGLMGAERLLDDQLAGLEGRINFVRDAYGRPLWVEPGQVQPALPGLDIKLSIDLELQRLAHAELLRGIEEADAAGGRLVMADPRTGEVLAMVDIVRDVPDAVPYPWVVAPKPGQPRAHEPVVPPGNRYVTLVDDPQRKIHPALGRNRCVEDIYEPGSTFKPFVWSAITEIGFAEPDEVFEIGRGVWMTPCNRPIQDVHKSDTLTWSEVLIHSSNIGMIKAAHRVSFADLHEVPVRFGFGKKVGIGLPGEASGIVTPMRRWSKYTQTSVAFGHEISVTPLQMVRAFCAYARTGELAGTLPSLRLTASEPDGPTGVTYRVLPREIAELTRQTMSSVVNNMESRYAKPPEGERWRYTLFGKSGTAEIPVGKAPPGKRRPAGTSGYFDNQYNSSFIAGGPVEAPRLVVVVVIDDPGPDRIHKRTHYGAAVAGPVVRRVMERSLTYLGVPPSP